MLFRSEGNEIKGGIYADATNGIDLNAITWTERDSVKETTSRMYYDYSSEEDIRVTETNDIGYNTRDKIVTGNLTSAGHTSLRSEQGDLNLTGTDINAGQQIALEGRNINLKAIAKKEEQFYQKGIKNTRDYTIKNNVVALTAENGISLTATGDKASGQGKIGRAHV